jgi:sodium-dependent phosphate cotransporter
MRTDGTDMTEERPVALEGDPAGARHGGTDGSSGAVATIAHGPRGRSGGMLDVARRLVLFAVAMYVFVLAIQLMKVGAKPIAAHISQGFFPFNNAISTLGLGMLLAYVTLSGKPVAALALSFFATGGISRLEAFTMLSGGRLGASFIVLLVGFLYSVRGRNRREAVGMGILSLALTALVYVPGMFIGYGILRTGLFDGVNLTSSGITNAVDLLWGPLTDRVGDALPGFALLVVGVLLIIVAIKLLDSVLPEIDGERQAGANAGRFRRPWWMFFFGSLTTLVTQSVSVSLTVLVPLGAKGYVKREEAIPYIMGANVTTLADTLLLAIVIGNVVGIQIVLAEFAGVLLTTAFYLAFLYRPLQRGMLALDAWAVGSSRRLAASVATLVVLPLLFMLSGLFAGHAGA